MDEQFEQDIRDIRIKAIETIIEYLYYDEKKHFEETTGFEGEEEDLIIKIHNAIIEGDWGEIADGEFHIFRYLTTIAFWSRLEERLRRNTYGE